MQIHVPNDHPIAPNHAAGAVGTDAFQECNAVELTKPCTKWSYQIQSLEEVQAVVHEAFRVANSGKKGPVHLDLPKDIMTTILDGDLLPPPQMPEEPEADMEVIQRVADMINRARKPIIYAGQGAINAGLEVSELANKNSIPTTTTLHAMGIFDENNPLSLHMLGMHGAVSRRTRKWSVSCHVMSCHVMSCHVMSCHVMSCHVISRLRVVHT
jgi:acetolactate synthase-1/2/3 large subunit